MFKKKRPNHLILEMQKLAQRNTRFIEGHRIKSEAKLVLGPKSPDSQANALFRTIQLPLVCRVGRMGDLESAFHSM